MLAFVFLKAATAGLMVSYVLGRGNLGLVVYERKRQVANKKNYKADAIGAGYPGREQWQRPAVVLGAGIFLNVLCKVFVCRYLHAVI